MQDRLLTPSKITAWLDCGHFLTLRHEVDDGIRQQPPHMFGEMASMLAEKGLAHEQQVLARYTGAGRVVQEVPGRRTGQTFTAGVDRVGDVLGDGHEILFQVPLVHNGIRGRGALFYLQRSTHHEGYVPPEARDR